MYEYHEAILKASFPEEVRNAIRGMFDEAYTMTNELIQREKWLTENPVARDIRPDILRAASARTAQLWCAKGILPFRCSFQTNSIKNCHHVELNGEGVILLLARVDAPKSIPPSSTFRDNVFDINIPLFPEYAIEKNPNIKQGFLATYGDRGKYEFQFGRVGIPGAKTWLAELPLARGPFGYITQKDHEEMLVELLDNARRVGEKSAGESED
ncbi:hypothetical protein [Sporomusa malonica]|uniref:Uncharacterized protein n=1 Tax=Sporomusa malonica TaxID=112901 RepID=A0A1W2F2W1_9FIRM|nr:hypothetical protein [Sporomusa malonica]SMD16142.1 hypothetical protein SAMN04488500_14011 [Sporomusa malonica]